MKKIDFVATVNRSALTGKYHYYMRCSLQPEVGAYMSSSYRYNTAEAAVIGAKKRIKKECAKNGGEAGAVTIKLGAKI